MSFSFMSRRPSIDDADIRKDEKPDLLTKVEYLREHSAKLENFRATMSDLHQGISHLAGLCYGMSHVAEELAACEVKGQQLICGSEVDSSLGPMLHRLSTVTEKLSEQYYRDSKNLVSIFDFAAQQDREVSKSVHETVEDRVRALHGLQQSKMEASSSKDQLLKFARLGKPVPVEVKNLHLDAQKKCEGAERAYQALADTLDTELNRVHKARTGELVSALTSVCAQQSQLAQSTASMWSQVSSSPERRNSVPGDDSDYPVLYAVPYDNTGNPRICNTEIQAELVTECPVAYDAYNPRFKKVASFADAVWWISRARQLRESGQSDQDFDVPDVDGLRSDLDEAEGSSPACGRRTNFLDPLLSEDKKQELERPVTIDSGHNYGHVVDDMETLLAE
eukprot:gene13830-16344_t